MALTALVLKKLIITQKIAQKSCTSNQNETKKCGKYGHPQIKYGFHCTIFMKLIMLNSIMWRCSVPNVTQIGP